MPIEKSLWNHYRISDYVISINDIDLRKVSKDKNKILKKDVSDLFEVNEAFSVVTEKFIRDLDIDREKINVNGGAMALGHPIGATGSILVNTVLDELERRDVQFGLVTMCAAGGMAPAVIIERV